jgi:hypothetical protein
MKSFDDRIRELPPELQQEVESLLQLLKARIMSEVTTPSTVKFLYTDTSLDLGWKGALQEMSEEYSSVDLQHKALDWWNE